MHRFKKTLRTTLKALSLKSKWSNFSFILLILLKYSILAIQIKLDFDSKYNDHIIQKFAVSAIFEDYTFYWQTRLCHFLRCDEFRKTKVVKIFTIYREKYLKCHCRSLTKIWELNFGEKDKKSLHILPNNFYRLSHCHSV